MTITIPSAADPELSVVMVTRGAWDLTERAIAALVERTERPLELIVVDNASDGRTRTGLSELSGARVLVNERNRGFGPAVNQGAELARGERLLLLNTDAFVHEGWLEPLLEALGEPGVAAAVPRCLHPDGSLQEAGALLARDGTVLMYGDGDDPGRPCYLFRRVIDYGSAVCMLVRAADFRDLGGFDERYAPAYYEDADLCLRLAERGRAVVYEPRSTVTHVRYGSGEARAAADLSARNRRVFAERWRSRLAGRPPTFVNASEQAAIWSRDALAAPRVLLCAQAREPGAEQLVAAVLGRWPRGRLTWALDGGAPDRFDPGPWRARGVEVLDGRDPAWLDGRLFHYDVVIGGDRVGGRLLAALDRSQPQAPRLALSELQAAGEVPASPLVGALARSGIAPLLPSPP